MPYLPRLQRVGRVGSPGVGLELALQVTLYPPRDAAYNDSTTLCDA